MAEGNIKNEDLFAKDAITKTLKDVKKLIGEFEKLEKVVIDVAKASKKDLSKTNTKTVSGLNKQKEAIEKINIAEKASNDIKKRKQQLQARFKAANSDEIQGNVLLNEQLKEQNRINRRIVTENNKVFGAYKNLSTRLNRLRKEYKDLAAQEAQGIKLSKEQRKTMKRLRTEINSTDASLKKIDKSVGQSQRNVGNYTSAWGKLGQTIKRGFVALGIVGGVQAVSRAFRDAFNRIKEFDSEFATIRGLTGETTEELASLRQEIIDVAGSSRKTSNEVAKLATTLLTLGKTKDEVIDLLEPINNLAIGLQTTSEEAADFLGQTLNAFQKSSESGQEFADIIANVRKSTSLNFQRIKDALAFVAPTANALNLTLGRTSALIGVLQDNGIRAARAGRLLNTSFARLVKQGISLDEALNKINSSTDRLKTATDLFGAESFTLGLILSDNLDRVDELANSFDNLSEGSLKTLTDEQLDTLAGQFDILDSTYEKFILSIENGDGRISRAIKGTIKSIIGLIDTLTVLNTTVDDFTIQAEKGEKNFVETLIGSTDDIDEIFLRLRGQLNRTREQLKKVTDRRADIGGAFNKLFSPGTIGEDKGLEALEGQLRKRIEILQLAIDNPSQFLADAEKELDTVEEIEKTVKEIKKRELDLIDRDQLTKLEELKLELKQIEESRERLVTGTTQNEIDAFNGLTIQAEQLQKVIDVYERLLKGETREGGQIKKGPLSDKELRNAVAEDIEDRLKKEEEAIQRLQSIITDSLNTVGQLVDDLFIVKIERLNSDLLATQMRTDQLINKAEQSRLGAQESIAFEQKKEAELERERLETLKRQQQTQALFTVLQSYNSNVAGGSQSPLTDTVRDIGILRALAQSFGSAFDGVDDTGGRGDIDKKGGKLWVLHPREQVWSEKNRSEVGYKSREEIIDIVKNSENNSLLSNDLLQGNNIKVLEQSKNDRNQRSLLKEIKAVNRSLKSMHNDKDLIDVDSLRNVLKHTKKRGNKKVVTISKLHK